MMTNPAGERAFERIAGQSEDDLLIDLGRAIELEAGLGSFAGTDELKAAALGWLDLRRADFAATLCPSPLLQAITREGEKGERELFIAMFDMMTSLYTKLPVPVGTVTALFVRRGMRFLCGEEWPPAKPSAD